MILTLERRPQTDGVQMGDLYLDGAFLAFTLEPSSDEAHPCIPSGRYRIVMTMSTRFKRMMPLLLDVPGRSGIRIHSGNIEGDSSGCLILGSTRTNTTVGKSRAACNDFESLLAGPLARGEDIWIDVREGFQRMYA